MTEAKRVHFDYARLKGRIIEVCGKNGNFADAMGMSDAALSQRLAGKQSFTQAEIYKACKILQIPDDRISSYFFMV